MPVSSAKSRTTFAISRASRGGDRVSDLNVLFGTRATEEVVVRESLQSCRFANGQAAALCGVMVYEVVTILGHVACDRCGWRVRKLHPEAIPEMAVAVHGGGDVRMIRPQRLWELANDWRLAERPGVTGCEQIPMKIAVHVAACRMVAHAADAFVKEPVRSVVSAAVTGDELAAPVMSRSRKNIKRARDD